MSLATVEASLDTVAPRFYALHFHFGRMANDSLTICMPKFRANADFLSLSLAIDIGDVQICQKDRLRDPAP